MEVQEVVTCCRMSGGLAAGGTLGPRLAQVKMDTLFVRDDAFFMSMADELGGKLAKVSSHFVELKRANAASEAENVALRRARSEAVGVAFDVVDVCRHMEHMWPERWGNFKKMLKKQTLRKVMRSVSAKDRRLVEEHIRWCANYIRNQVGDDRLEKLLTLRSEMA